jgi:hypothetical protein
MEKLSSDRLQALIGGGVAGGTCSIALLFSGGAHDWLMIALKFGGLLIAAAATGMATLLGHDFYKYKIKPKLFKDGERKREEEKDKVA